MVNMGPAALKMAYGQENTKKSVHNEKPVSPLMYPQEAAAVQKDVDVMARIMVDECSQVYNFCQNSGEYSWLFCFGLIIDCRTNPVPKNLNDNDY